MGKYVLVITFENRAKRERNKQLPPILAIQVVEHKLILLNQTVTKSTIKIIFLFFIHLLSIYKFKKKVACRWRMS